jgi:DNA-binding transcriptional regulator YhcF (GntR family)
MKFKDSQPIFMQIAEHIMDNIMRGVWNAEERIPSVREMAVSIEVNPNTVMRTYSYLQDMEIIFNKRGVGFFVNDKAKEKVESIMKERFFNKELPEVFKTMELLKIKTDELQKLFADYLRSKNEGQK